MWSRVFLKKIMLKLGLDPRWTDIIMNYVSSVSYSFLVNGEITRYIGPPRWLRQDDSLSPYLFILCAEGMTSLIARHEQLDRIHGMSICRGAPIISHLLFADDNFLFLQDSFQECWHLKQISRSYELALGQCINFQKCVVSFSPNIRWDIQDQLAAFLGVRKVDVHDCYLGLSIILGHNQTERFFKIKDRLWKKLKG